MDITFLLVVGCFFAHELDAILHEEWRFFGALLRLDDGIMYQLFVALHVPLLLVFIWFNDAIWLQVGLSVFAIIHVGLHLTLRNHSLIGFDNWFSWVWILGAGVAGFFHLLIAHIL